VIIGTSGLGVLTSIRENGNLPIVRIIRRFYNNCEKQEICF